MKLLIAGKSVSDQVDRLTEEGRKLGHKVDNCSVYDLIIKAEKGRFEPQVKGLDIKSYDLIYLLTVRRRRWEWYVACDYLNKKHGIKIVEEKEIDDNIKIYQTATAELHKQVEEGINFPKTTVIVDDDSLEEALSDFEFPVIIKNSYAHRGLGIHKVDSLKEAEDVVGEDKKSKSFLIREFIPNDGDIRVFTIGFKAIGAMRRIPPKDDFRSNISVGGTAESFDLNRNPQIREIAEKMAKINRTQIAGVDVMIHKETKEPYVLEINRSPQFAGLEKYTGINVASKIIRYFETPV